MERGRGHGKPRPYRHRLRQAAAGADPAASVSFRPGYELGAFALPAQGSREAGGSAASAAPAPPTANTPFPPLLLREGPPLIGRLRLLSGAL